MAPPAACLTCTRSVETSDSVPIARHESAQSALSKYFWFNDEECIQGILCQDCWQKIDDFHRFYCEIEQLHSQHRPQPHYPIQMLEVKQEPIHDALYVAELQDDQGDEDVDMKTGWKVEAEDEGSSDDDVLDEIPEKDEVSDGDSPQEDIKQEPAESSTMRRRKHEKLSQEEKAQVDEFITKNMDVKCDTCSEKCCSFKELQRHSLEVHEKRAYLFCCGRKFCDWKRLLDHIRYHLNPDRFACTMCSKRCPSSETLASHMSIKHAKDEEKTFQCDRCPRKFSRQRLLTMHKKRHKREDDADEDTEDMDEKGQEGERDEKKEHKKVDKRRVDSVEDKWKQSVMDEKIIAQNINLECDTCKQQAKTFQELQDHSVAEHGKRANVFCCDRKFNSKQQLVEHIQFHLDPTQFQCDICLKQYHHSKGLKDHKDKKHSAEEAKTFKCSVCPKTFAKQVFLNNHERYHRRLEEKTWHCKECDKYFAFESMLQQHIRSVHTKEFSYVCHVCAKGFPVLSSYQWHMENKHAEPGTVKRVVKPTVNERVQCTVCGAWICSKKSLKEHMLRHTGSQRCDQCGQECKSVKALHYHQAQHKKGDFICAVCGKGFKQQLTLKEHMASHTGEVLYSCDFCDRTFNSRANRAAHRKKMHPKEWFEDKLRKDPHFQLQMNQGMGSSM